MTRQRTIKDTVTVEGIGLQTGKKVKLTLKSSPANSGINFIRIDLPNRPILNIRSMAAGDTRRPKRRTTLGKGHAQVETTEHLLAALSGLAIDNIVIELDSIELPGLDGSAKVFVEALKKSGIVEQDAPRNYLKIEKQVWCADRDSILAALPDDSFKISYAMSYKDPALGNQFFSMAINESNFESQIAPARTFCLKKEAMALRMMGLGKGANYNNTLIIGHNGPMKNKFRFSDEPVRHKALDLMGDLYLLGMPLKGHVIAVKSGHRLNMELVRKLKGETYG